MSLSYGKDERDIHKHVWQLPIPAFDGAVQDHRRLADLGALAEREVAGLDLDGSRHFPALRRDVREHLAQSPTGREIDELVESLLLD